MRLVKILALLTLLAATFASGYLVRASKQGTTATPARRVLYYVDTMNPAYRSDKPGVAPDGMALQPVYADEVPAQTGGPGHTILYYQDPQDPKYHADKPGLNPETGNTLEPVYAEAASTVPPGAIRIAPERQQ